ncbi:MAG TPA: FHA domain-containing protein [Polyangiaceae bacterium]
MVWRSNASTCLPTAVPPMAAPSLRTVYSVALAAEKEREPASGYRLYWMGPARFGSCDVPVDSESYVIVGRHALCDAVLDSDPQVALRHLMVRASRLDDGAPRLSIVDLHTGLGFALADGRNARTLVATGPLGIVVGGYAIVALPGGEPPAPELPAARVATLASAGSPYRDAPPVPSITLLPRAPLFGESASFPHASVAVSVTSARGAAVVRVSALDLELGVLVGRAPKCNDVLRTVLNEGISRVHLLLRKNIAYDLASTQGTYVGGRRVRSAPIESGSPIQLGSVSPVYVHVAIAER